jgi:putative hemolysin
MAVVLDEYGILSGIVTMNDLVEQLVGDLGDDEEKTRTQESVTKIDENTWKVNGRIALDEVTSALDITIIDKEYDTFSGYVFNLLGTIPPDGETADIETDKLVVNILEIEDHQIKTALIHKK